jgi:hypothetical protein
MEYSKQEQEVYIYLDKINKIKVCLDADAIKILSEKELTFWQRLKSFLGV